MLSVRIANYRCFTNELPVTLRLDKGFAGVVGANNSGKSALLRFFFDLRPLFTSLSSHSQSFKTALRAEEGLHPPGGDHLALFSNSNSLDMDLDFMITEALPSPENIDDSPVVDRIAVKVLRDTGRYTVRLFVGEQQFTSPGVENDLQAWIVKRPDGFKADMGSVYHAFRLLTDCFYAGSFRSILPYAGKVQEFDMVIGQPFVHLWRDLKSGDSRANNALADRITTDIEKAFGFRRLEINPSASGENLHVRIDGNSYRLDEVGGGLAHFVVLLGNLGRHKASYLLIDEPELNLHPTLQAAFLRTAAAYVSEGVMFATHSLGLAHSFADVALTVRTLGAGKSQVSDLRSSGALAEIAGELGIGAYRDLGHKGMLLVEGPNDVRTMFEFLSAFDIDKKLVVIPLGGCDMINGSRRDELAELTRLSPRIWAVVDSERTSGGSDPAGNVVGFASACAELGIDCLVLERRAIENYLTSDAIARSIGPGRRELEPFEAFKESDQTWSKKQNWRIARQMGRENIEGTDLGRFLAKIAQFINRQPLD